MEKKTDLRIIKTHIALHNAFTHLMSKKTFEDITISELCDAAMIRRTTFYKYFTDKYDYFNFYISEIIKKSRNSVSLNTITDNPIEYTEKILSGYFEFMRQNLKLVNNLKNSNMVSFFFNSLQQQYESELRFILIDVKHYPPSPQLDFTISLVAGGLITALGWWLENPDTFSNKEIAQLIVETLSFPHALDKNNE